MKPFRILSLLLVLVGGALRAEAADASAVILVCTGEPQIIHGVPSTRVSGHITIDFQSRDVQVSLNERTIPPFSPETIEDYTESFRFNPSESCVSVSDNCGYHEHGLRLLDVDQGGGTPSVQNDFSLEFSSVLPAAGSNHSIGARYSHKAGYDDGDRGPGTWTTTTDHNRQLTCFRGTSGD